MQQYKRLLNPTGGCLITSPELAKITGRTEAIFLQQLHYWLTSSEKNGIYYQDKRWIYNTYQDWQQQLKIVSISTVRRVVKKLEKFGFITCRKLNKKRSDQTKWYTINYESLGTLIESAQGNSHVFKMSSPYAQNEQIIYKETEITSENKPISSGEIKVVGRGGETKQVHDVEKDNKSINKNPEYKSNLAVELLEIWNQIVAKEQGQEENLVQLTKKRAQHLVAAFKYRFESNQLKWKQFCQQVTSSDFLMGKVKATFKASLDWILKFDVIQRILEGDFGVKEVSFVDERDTQPDEETLSKHIESSCESEAVKQFRKSILKTFGEQTYQSWFADMTIREEVRGVMLTAKSQFMRDYIQTHYLDKLEALTNKVFPIFCA